MMSKKMLSALTLTSASVVFACSSGGGRGTTSKIAGVDGSVPTTTVNVDDEEADDAGVVTPVVVPGQDASVVVTPGVGTGATNPYGVAYPSTKIGIAPRGDVTSGVAGSRLQNFAFKGVLSGNPSDAITRVSMSQFFDPESRTHKLIFIQAAGVWCSVCHSEANAITPRIKELKDRGVVWLTAIIESSSPGKPAALVDLSTWYNRHKTPSPLLLDSGAESLGAFFSAAAMPWNAIIDARSMEILEADVGSSQNVWQHIDGQAKAWTAWQDANAPLSK